MSERTRWNCITQVDNCAYDVTKGTTAGEHMHLQHKHDRVGAQLIVVGGAEGGHVHYMACVASVKGEPWQTTQIRWDDFARQMYAVGVEPVTDTPVYTVTEGDVVYDHYVLHEIQDHDETPEIPFVEDYRLETND